MLDFVVMVSAAGAAELAALTARLEALEAQTSYAHNTLLLLISGVVVMFMAAGFCMLETGLVRQRNAATIALKNITLYAIAGLAYFVIGYGLMYNLADGARFFGAPGLFSAGPDDAIHGAYSGWADWFFQMVFVATAASIVSGTLAERIKLWPFLIFVLALTAIIYPIQGAWKWGGGWLDQIGFQDFAGSTLVHSAGGWAALTGAIILGAREGRYGPDGRVTVMPGSNLPLAALGTFILWFGWFGFNGGSQLAFDSVENINAVGKILANTNTSAAAGVLAAAGATALLYKKVDLTLALNGAIGGLVSITAEPLAPALWQSAIIGAIGGLIVVFTVPWLDKFKVDDVVGAIPAHLACGVWGTLIVAWNTQAEVNGATLSGFEQLGVQIAGIVAIGVFVSLASALTWLALKATLGLRANAEDQREGLDKSECGLEAYPDFAKH